MLLVQPVVAGDPTQHLRYERAIALPANASGPVCAVLDAAVFAHASRSATDLRVFRESSATEPQPTEVAFTLLESEALPDDAVAAAVQNLTVRGDTLGFDLLMPPQLYSAVELHLAATNFLATANVSAGDVQLGSFTLFDLTQEHLARSTELALQETRVGRLHVDLRLWHLDGTPVDKPSPSIVQGAEVPPSRQAQTLYTTVSEAAPFQSHGGHAVAKVRVPAHVPVERIRFVPASDFQGSFERSVTVTAQASNAGPGVQEVVEGTIFRIDRPAPSPGAPAVRYASLTVDATLGANLREPAVVSVAIDGPRVPVRAVELQMRQRSFCFTAAAGERYTLRYGDAGLSPPVYQEMTDTLPNTLVDHASSTPAQQARLGPEQENPAFVGRISPFSAGGGHPEMFWVGLLSMVTLTGALAVHRMRPVRRGGGR
jgi:hypothetical protein